MPDMTQSYEIMTGMESVKLYFNTAAAVEPEPGGSLTGWTSLGETDGGITVTVTREVQEHTVDQILGAVKGTISNFGLVVKASLAVATLENWAVLFGTTVEATTAGVGQIGKKRLPLYGGDTPALNAFYLTGKSAYGDYESGWWFPYAYIGGEAEIAYTKEGKAVLPIEIHVMADLSATSEDERFGVLTHKTADAT